VPFYPRDGLRRRPLKSVDALTLQKVSGQLYSTDNSVQSDAKMFKLNVHDGCYCFVYRHYFTTRG